MQQMTFGVPVEIHPVGQNGYELIRGGEPYFIKGIGSDGDFERLAELGANSVRTWGSDNWGTILDDAQEHGLTVLAGVWMIQERQGFDYHDTNAVQDHLSRHKKAIAAFRDHPAVLMWAVGNELEIPAADPVVWDAVEELAKWIKQTDPTRPVMTVTAYPSVETLQDIRKRAPSIDVLGVNAYAPIARLADHLEKHWGGPYVVAEWGPDGQWEAPKTDWGVVLEESSTTKRQLYYERHKYITNSPACLGSYAFLWKHKVEATLTWFGMKLEDGRELDTVEGMYANWNGHWPDYQTPGITKLTLQGVEPADNLVVRVGEPMVAEVQCTNDQDVKEIGWELTVDEHRPAAGGDAEPRPESVPVNFHPLGVKVEFSAPKMGTYRLYVYVEGSRGRVATANFPFKVIKRGQQCISPE